MVGRMNTKPNGPSRLAKSYTIRDPEYNDNPYQPGDFAWGAQGGLTRTSTTTTMTSNSVPTRPRNRAQVLSDVFEEDLLEFRPSTPNRRHDSLVSTQSDPFYFDDLLEFYLDDVLDTSGSNDGAVDDDDFESSNRDDSPLDHDPPIPHTAAPGPPPRPPPSEEPDAPEDADTSDDEIGRYLTAADKANRYCQFLPSSAEQVYPRPPPSEEPDAPEDADTSDDEIGRYLTLADKANRYYQLLPSSAEQVHARQAAPIVEWRTSADSGHPEDLITPDTPEFLPPGYRFPMLTTTKSFGGDPATSNLGEVSATPVASPRSARSKGSSNKAESGTWYGSIKKRIRTRKTSTAL